MPLHLATHSGSLEHPYHFWLGYYIPICEWLLRNPETGSNVVVECGPMTPWLENLNAFREVSIVKPRTALSWHLRGPEYIESNIFEYLDDPRNFSKSEGLKNIQMLKRVFFPESEPKSESIQIGILQRNHSLPFYNSAESEIKTSGAERRDIPNINELKVLLGADARTSIIDTSEASPNDSVAIYAKLSVLVGQYGAGLTNMIWMPKGSLVIELRGPGILTDHTWDDCYKTLAESLGHRFEVLEAQKDWHSPIDSERVGKQIKKLIRSSSSPIISLKDFAKKSWKIS
jgi:hypothetical protein